MNKFLVEPEFVIQCGLFSYRMRVRNPQCALHINLSFLGLILLITILWAIQLDLVGWRSVSRFQSHSLKPRYRGSVGL